ncbi:MAG TPA: AraC family transcriptional regulator [Gemmatimonadaceae bacterium]
MIRSFISVALEEAHLAPGERLRRHEHEDAHACMVINGAFGEQHRGNTVWCAAGAARISPAGDRHHIDASGAGARCLLITVGAGSLLHDELRPPSERRFLRAGSLDGITQRLLGALADADVTPFEVELLALEAFAPAHGDSERTRAWIDVVRDHLHDTPAIPSATDLGSLTGRHPVYVARAFRRRFGCSIGGYARRLRAARAHHLLVTSKRPLSIVALDSGYSDQAHMTRDLRRRLGTTPAAFRAEVRGVQ